MIKCFEKNYITNPLITSCNLSLSIKNDDESQLTNLLKTNISNTSLCFKVYTNCLDFSDILFLAIMLRDSGGLSLLNEVDLVVNKLGDGQDLFFQIHFPLQYFHCFSFQQYPSHAIYPSRHLPSQA